MRPIVLKRVLPRGQGVRIHISQECAQGGKLSFVLCKGFTSLGEHEEVGEQEHEYFECSQCAKIAAKMLKHSGKMKRAIDMRE